MVVRVKSLEELRLFAERFANELAAPITIALQGDLGMGKTELSRRIIQALSGGDVVVPSPTFTIVQTYDSKKGPIYHFDLYRVEDKSELVEIGLEDAVQNGITLIEWPEIAREFLNPTRTIWVKITAPSEDSREIEIVYPK